MIGKKRGRKKKQEKFFHHPEGLCCNFFFFFNLCKTLHHRIKTIAAKLIKMVQAHSALYPGNDIYEIVPYLKMPSKSTIKSYREEEGKRQKSRQNIFAGRFINYLYYNLKLIGKKINQHPTPNFKKGFFFFFFFLNVGLKMPNHGFSDESTRSRSNSSRTWKKISLKLLWNTGLNKFKLLQSCDPDTNPAFF